MGNTKSHRVAWLDTDGILIRGIYRVRISRIWDIDGNRRPPSNSILSKLIGYIVDDKKSTAYNAGQSNWLRYLRISTPPARRTSLSGWYHVDSSSRQTEELVFLIIRRSMSYISSRLIRLIKSMSSQQSNRCVVRWSSESWSFVTNELPRSANNTPLSASSSVCFRQPRIQFSATRSNYRSLP
jgi:hypothetical protein